MGSFFEPLVWYNGHSMKPYVFRTIIEPDDPKGYHGFVPLLPGVHTCGDTPAEVTRNLRDAIKCHIQGLLKDNCPIPQEGDALEAIQIFEENDLLVAYA